MLVLTGKSWVPAQVFFDLSLSSSGRLKSPTSSIGTVISSSNPQVINDNDVFKKPINQEHRQVVTRDRLIYLVWGKNEFKVVGYVSGILSGTTHSVLLSEKLSTRFADYRRGDRVIVDENIENCLYLWEPQHHSKSRIWPEDQHAKGEGQKKYPYQRSFTVNIYF